MTIRVRITAVAVAVLLAVAVILISFGYRSQSAAEARYVSEVLSGKRLLWEQIGIRLQEGMAAYRKALTRDSVALKALRKGDLGVVREQAATTHNMLSADGTLERLQLFDKEANYIAAFPDAQSGPTEKTLVKAVLEEPTVRYGINRDDDGSLQAIAAFPLYVRGKLRAVAVYSQGIQALVDSFQASDGSDVFVYTLDGRKESAGSQNQFEVTTVPRITEENGGMEVIREGSQYRVNVAAPIRDDRGNPIAHLVTSQDQTETYRVQVMSTYTSFGLVLVVLIASTIGLFWYFRSAFRPIEQVVNCMTAISDGHLDFEPPVSAQDDETGRLSAGLREMVGQLRLLIGKISEVTEQLIGSTAYLNDIADQSKIRITNQREETDQVATAANEMAATIQEVARSASTAALAANHASERTRDGSGIMENTISSIEGLAGDVEQAGEVIMRLHAESENIGSVLDVIRGIAEQTNLLALNAAIEAARAGEQGRGFAVVADEVRTLAGRTQQSTQDIQAMIETLQNGAIEAVSVMKHSQESSAETLKRASAAQGALQEITESVGEIDDMNSQIATAAEEQSAVSEMISQSVTRIATLAEESLTAVEQTARSAGEISATGKELGGLVHRFEL